MAGRFERKKFSDCSLEDRFFDSLKEDYPEFCDWFSKKADAGEEAFVFGDDMGICAFVYLKENENEEIKLVDRVLPKQNRIKIGTLKLEERQQGQRLGEGAIGIVLWKWQESNVDEIYLTVYDYHKELIALIEKFGFVCAGELPKYGTPTINHKELLYIKNKKSLDYSNPHKSFPYLSPDFTSAGVLPIYDYYHDRLLPYSELKNTSQEFWDEAAGNGITKMFIGSPNQIGGLCEGSPIFMYRKCTEKGVPATYKSCITSFATITKIIVVKKQYRYLINENEYKRLCGNKTIFSSEELKRIYMTSRPNLVVFEFVYNGFFGRGNNVVHKRLKENNLFETYPYGIRYSLDDFSKIIEMGGKNVQNIIIDKSRTR